MKRRTARSAPIGIPATRRARRAAETRERIFRAAMRLFAERGFLNTTVEDVTELADVGKGTFFNYFPSKGHVLQALAEIQIGNVAAALEDIRSSGDSLEVILPRLGRVLAREPGQSPALVRSLVLAIHSSEEVRQMMTANLARGRELLAEIMSIGQQRGEIRRDLPAEELARLFQQSLFGMFFVWTVHPPVRLDEWVEETFDMFWSGIGAGKR